MSWFYNVFTFCVRRGDVLRDSTNTSPSTLREVSGKKLGFVDFVRVKSENVLPFYYMHVQYATCNFLNDNTYFQHKIWVDQIYWTHIDPLCMALKQNLTELQFTTSLSQVKLKNTQNHIDIRKIIWSSLKNSIIYKSKLKL